MPYVSDKQRRFFHTDTARKKGIKPEVVEEFDEASKGMKMPEHAMPKTEDMPMHKDPKPTEITASSKSHWRRE